MKRLFSLFGRSRDDGADHSLDLYKRFRQLGRTCNLALIKQLPPPALPECGKKLGIYKAGTLILNQDDEIAVAYDYCLHHHRRAGRNIIERTLENPPPAMGSDEMTYLQTLSAARFSLFRIDEILPHRGARLRDLLMGESVAVMDLGLSSTGMPGIIVAGRLLRFDAFAMSSGTLIPIPEPILESRIQPVIGKFIPNAPHASPALSPAQWAAFEGQILRIALHDGGEDNTFYTDMEV